MIVLKVKPPGLWWWREVRPGTRLAIGDDIYEVVRLKPWRCIMEVKPVA